MSSFSLNTDLIYSDTKLTFIDLLLCDRNQFILILLKNLLPKPLLKSLDYEKLYILEELYYDNFGDIIEIYKLDSEREPPLAWKSTGFAMRVNFMFSESQSGCPSE